MPTLFERAFVITLPFRTDRIESFRRQTANIRYLPEIEVWPAIHGDTCQPPEIWTAGAGAWGCYRSHMNILEYCLNNKINSYIVFEDDAQFRPEFDQKLETFYNALPSDWQQIYLGGALQHTSTHPPIKVNDHVYRPFNVNRTHCFAVSRPGMLPIYRHIANLPYVPEEHIDHHLGRWHEDYRNAVYAPAKWLVGQMGFTSNISGKDEEIQFFSDPDSLRIDHWLYDKPICVYYSGQQSLLRSARAYLHPGNQLDANGYDITLSNAARYIDPVPEITRWYNWIRSEIAQTNLNAIPCFNHPRFTIEQVQNALQMPVIPFAYNSLPEIRERVEELIRNHAI